MQLANGAKELLDEVATGKITGEEDRYSHTDLWDFQANVEGSQGAVAALRPVIDDKNKQLGPTLDERFAAVDDLLEQLPGRRRLQALHRADRRPTRRRCPRPSTRWASRSARSRAS